MRILDDNVKLKHKHEEISTNNILHVYFAQLQHFGLSMRTKQIA